MDNLNAMMLDYMKYQIKDILDTGNIDDIRNMACGLQYLLVSDEITFKEFYRGYLNTTNAPPKNLEQSIIILIALLEEELAIDERADTIETMIKSATLRLVAVQEKLLYDAEEATILL